MSKQSPVPLAISADSDLRDELLVMLKRVFRCWEASEKTRIRDDIYMPEQVDALIAKAEGRSPAPQTNQTNGDL